MEPILPKATRTTPRGGLDQTPAFKPGQWVPLWLSARTAGALEEVTANLASHLARHPELRPQDVAFTLLAGREHFNHRRVLTSASLAEAVGQLGATTRSAQQSLRKNGLLAIFPDCLSPYPGAGRGMYAQFAVFRNHLDHCAELLSSRLPLDLRQLLFSDDRKTAKTLARRAVGRPLALALQTALYHTWRSMGYTISELVGVGLGQWAGACCADIFDLECMLQLGVLLGEVEDGTRHRSLLVEALANAAPKLGDRPLVSGSSGTLVTQTELADPSTWIEAIERTSHDPTPLLQKPGCATLVLGPASWLQRAPSANAPIYAMREADCDRDDGAFTYDTAGGLYLEGLTPDWKIFFASSDYRRVPLPGYPFQHQRYWFTPGQPAQPRAAATSQASPVTPAADLQTKAPDELKAYLDSLDEATLDRMLRELEQAAAPPLSPAAVHPTPQAMAVFEDAAHARPEMDTAYLAPRDALEQRLAQICAKMLQIDKIGIDDNIVHMGADSIFTMQLSRDIEKEFGVLITPHHLFAQPTIASLAKTIREERK